MLGFEITKYTMGLGFGVSAAASNLLLWLLRLNSSLTADTGDSATFSGSSVTYARTYDATSGVLLKPLGINQPAFEGLRYTEFNSCAYSRTFNAVGWVQSGTPTFSKAGNTGVFGDANSATQITDNDAAAFEFVQYDVVIANDSSTHSMSVFVGKDTDETRFPVVALQQRDGTTITEAIRINTKDGTVYETSSDGSYSVVDYNTNFWQVNLSLPNNASGNTTLRVYLQPAVSATLSGASDVAVTGTTVFDQVDIRLNSSTVDEMIVTNGVGAWGNPVNTADDGTTPLHPTDADGVYLSYDDHAVSTAYSLNDYVVASDGTHYRYYKCTTAGTTGASAPTWTTGSSISDGTAVWAHQGLYMGRVNGNGGIPYALSESEATNSCTYSRNFDPATSDWTEIGGAVTLVPATGIDGVSTSGTQITDDNAVDSSESVSFSVTVPNDSNTHSVRLYVNKTTSATVFPAIVFQLTGGTALVEQAGINTNTGAVYSRTGEADGAVTAKSFNKDFWELVVSLTNNSTGNTTLLTSIRPANNDGTAGGFGPAYTGSAVFDQVDILLNTTADEVGTPILTSGATGTRAASSLASTQSITSDKIRFRPAKVGVNTYLTDGVDGISYTGSNIEVTDGTNTLSVAASLGVGDTIGWDNSTGKLYHNGSVIGTDATVVLSWASPVTLKWIVDIEEDSALDLTEVI